MEGTVVVRAIISRSGSIESAQALSGPTMLQQAALEAVERARYRPFLLNGQPTEGRYDGDDNFPLGELKKEVCKDLLNSLLAAAPPADTPHPSTLAVRPSTAARAARPCAEAPSRSSRWFLRWGKCSTGWTSRSRGISSRPCLQFLRPDPHRPRQHEAVGPKVQRVPQVYDEGPRLPFARGIVEHGQQLVRLQPQPRAVPAKTTAQRTIRNTTTPTTISSSSGTA